MRAAREHYAVIEKAIQFIVSQKSTRPSLQKIAEHVSLSPFHFQRLFSEWAGISPKQFLQALTLQHAKLLLQEKKLDLFDVTYQTGLSSTSRLHDLFMKIEAMSPAEYKNGGKGLQISYSYFDSMFGIVLVANTTRGICYLAFDDEQKLAKEELFELFPNAVFIHTLTKLQQQALQIINGDSKDQVLLKLHLKGSAFQLKVWEALLKIPEGKLQSYGSLAAQIQMPQSARAVGTAIGSNLVAFLIPCHRVIQQSGALGGYRWGLTRKAAMLANETGKQISDEELTTN